MRSRAPHLTTPGGFTLVELLISTTVIALLMVVLVTITGQTVATWRYTSGKVEEFRESRNAFERMTSRLSQATLNTYWDYDDGQNPKRYERRAELRFIAGQAAGLPQALLGDMEDAQRVSHCVFFHAPLGLTESRDYRGLENLLNTWGYYVEYRDDLARRPAFVSEALAPKRHRSRLMEFMQPTERNPIYFYTSGWDGTGAKAKSAGYMESTWFKPAVNRSDAPSHAVAENVIALIITPRLAKRDEQAHPLYQAANPDYSPLAPYFAYDSARASNDPLRKPGQVNDDARLNPKNQLPPVLQVTMVAMDEASAIRLGLGEGDADTFKVRGKFQDTAKLREELSGESADSLEQTLVARRVNYRIFSTTVNIRGAKWSREQVN